MTCSYFRVFSPAFGAFQAFCKLFLSFLIGPRLWRQAAMAGAFALALLLASVAGLRAQQTSTEAQSSGSSREPWPAQFRGASRAADIPMAGAFEGPADPAAVPAERVGDFGVVKGGVTSPAKALRFIFKRSATLGSIDVVTKGAKGLDFDDAHTGTCKAGKSYYAGDTCTVDATFKPRFAGARSGAAILRDEEGKPLAVHPLFGSVMEAQIAYTPFTQTILQKPAPVMVMPFKAAQGVAIDGSGNIFVADPGLGYDAGYGFTTDVAALYWLVPQGGATTP
ncbi:MAG: hypothetical protein ABSF53_19245 [Terracidiphilus sp.]